MAVLTGGVGAVVWLAVSVVLFVIESVTVQLLCIWFAVGGLAAMAASLLGVPLWQQLLWFLVVSLATLLPGRGLLKKRFIKPSVPTNADQVIGQIAVVESDIDNVAGGGRVMVNGLSWAARTDHGEEAPAGSEVRALRIEGVTLIVEPLVPATKK